MKHQIQLYFILFSVTLTITACNDVCEEDIHIANYKLSTVAKNHLPETVLDTLIYTNGTEEFTITTKENIITIQDTMVIRELCHLKPPETYQLEVAGIEQQFIEYIFEDETLAFKFGITFGTSGCYRCSSFDSLAIFEFLYISTNYDEDPFWDSDRFFIYLNDIHNKIDFTFTYSTIIQDTILNNVEYSQVYKKNDSQTNVFYTIEKGVVAFERLGEMLYLKE